MKIVVTYENGEVFQHFGRTPQFKVYDIENGEATCDHHEHEHIMSFERPDRRREKK